MRAVPACIAALLMTAVAFLGIDARAQAPSLRSALLIANAAYPDSDAVLPTPIEDARAFSEALKQRGFSTDIVENLGKEAMQQAIEKFVSRAEPHSLALVFFAGYGIQVGRKNYLIPVDARIWSESDVLRDGISVDSVFADLEKRNVGTRVMVLDASRRNPFERRFRSFSMGLAAMKAAPGMISLHSASPGSVVADTNANRSLFVTELVKQVGLPEISAEQAFAGVSEALAKATRGQQKPVLTSGLDLAFAFDPAAKAPPPSSKPSGDLATKLPAEDPMPDVPAKAEPAKAEPVKAEPPADKPSGGWVDPKPPAGLTKPAKPVVAAEPEADPSEGKSGKTAPTIVATNKADDSPLAAELQAVKDFDAAREAGTKPAYETFLAKHPAGALAAKARAEIARIDAAKLAPVKVVPPKPYSAAEIARKAALDQRIAKDPRDEVAYYERGQFHAQRGDAAPAIADFDEAIRLNPDNAEAFNNRCWMRAVANDLQRALKDCNEALKLHPDYLDALDSRGFVNLKSGSYEAALADYEAALRVNANHSSALYGRGVARRRLGQSAQADKDFVNALQLNPAIDKEFAQFGLR